MTPRLPPELLSEILAFAEEGQELLERQKLRNAFRQVCRDWCLAFNYWVEMSAQGRSQIEGLAALLLSRAGSTEGDAPLGHRVRALYASVSEEVEKVGTNALAELIGAVPHVNWLGLKVGTEGFPRAEAEQEVLVNALAKLQGVKDFIIWPPPRQHRPISAALLQRISSSWTTLELFTLYADAVKVDLPPNTLFATHPNLRWNCVPDTGFLSQLPDTVRYVGLISLSVRRPDSHPPRASNEAGQVYAGLEPLAPQLHGLSLIGRLGSSGGRPLRGYHERLVSRLRDVRELLLPPFAVADLAGALGPLSHLREVEIWSHPDDDRAAQAIGASEVVQLLEAAKSLRELTLPEPTVGHWTEEGRQAVREAAERKGVELVDKGGWSG